MSSEEDLREEAKRRLPEIEQACDQLSEDEFDRATLDRMRVQRL